MLLITVNLLFILLIIKSSIGSEELTTPSVDGLNSLVQLDDLPIPSGDLESLRSSHVTDASVQLVADEALVSQLELIPFIDCVSRATGKRFPTIDDVINRLESYTLSQFIDEMFKCLQSKAFRSKRRLKLLRQTATGLTRLGSFRPEEKPKVEEPDREELPPKVKPGKIERPEEKPGKIERPNERPDKIEQPNVIPRPGKERGDGRVEIFFVRLRWVLWQYLRQLKKQGGKMLSSNSMSPGVEGRTIFFHSDPIYQRRHRFRVARLPITTEIDCILFGLKCNTLIMDSGLSQLPVRLSPAVVTEPILDSVDYDYDDPLADEDGNVLTLSDNDNLGGLIADSIEDVAKTVYRFGGGFRRVQRHFNRFLNSGADLILG